MFSFFFFWDGIISLVHLTVTRAMYVMDVNSVQNVNDQFFPLIASYIVYRSFFSLSEKIHSNVNFALSIIHQVEQGNPLLTSKYFK